MAQHVITPEALAESMRAGADVFLLDVRGPDEHQAFNIGGLLVPLAELPNQIDELPRNRPIVVYCRSGHRSQSATEYLRQQGFVDVRNLVGGVIQWRALFDEGAA